MEDTPVASETANRRTKRTRAQTAAAADADRTTKASGDNRGETSDRSDQSPNQAEFDDSFDDFEGPRSKSKRKRTSEGASAAAPVDGQSLIEVIKGNGKLISQVVKVWVEQYEKDSKPAMVGLLMMLFEACGAKYRIREEFLDETDVDDVVVALVSLARRGEVEDYQSSKKKEFKNFKDNLTSFWDNLVIECQSGPLFDQVLFDKCMDYVIALSCTPPRIFRQVASLVGLQLVTSLINVAKTLGAQRETTQRQLNAERKKHIDGPRVESLNKRLSMTHEKITVIDTMMRKIFTGLFVHRYRDIDPEIRMSCIQSLGVWILSYPSLFLQDLYLKYLGWTLNDKNAGVRKASVLALQNLYEVDDSVPSLGLFTERFSNRMIELADDIDISVAVCGIGLVKQLLRHQLLNEDDLGSLYDLLIDDPPEIRRAIGSLVYEHLIAQKSNSSQSHSRGNDDDSSEVHLGRMLQILREFSTDQILSTYVIDDVWEYMDAMKDWKCILSMLLDENPMIELTDEDATNLIRLLSASVKKAVGERIVPATDNRKQYYNKAQREMMENNRRDVTISMMKRYPQLLRKFMADKGKIAPLVDIVINMNLELYSLKRQEQHFKTVLQLVKEAFCKHGEKDILRCCVKAINFCNTESRGELQDFAQNKLKELEDELISKLKSAMSEVAGGDDEYSLLVTLKRLYELQLSRSVPIESLYDEMGDFLKRFHDLDDEVVNFLLLNMYLHVAWCLHSIINSGTVPEESVHSLLAKRSTLFQHLEYYYLETLPENQGEGKGGNKLACRVCTVLAEMWCLFRQTNFASTNLDCLGYCPEESSVQKFWKLCEQQLNISDETEDEEVQKEYVEETNRDAIMIAACKLIATDAVPKEYLGPEIISHFVMHGTSVAEIVKHLIAVLKKKDDDVSKLFLEALKRKCLDKRNLVCSWCRFGPSANKFFFATQTINRHYYSRVLWDTLATTYILQESIKLCMSVFERRVVHVFVLNSVGSRGLQVSFMPESDYFIKSLASCQRSMPFAKRGGPSMMKYLEHARSHTTVLQDSCGLRLEMEFLHEQRLSSEELAYHRHTVVALESNDYSLAGKSFQECKDLAARLSGMFVGAARNKHLSEIMKIVKDGIDYAFIDAPKQISFLDGAVVHFVSKLPTPDILEILKDVQKRTENVNTEVDPSGWRPYITFVDGLNDKYAKNEDFQVAEEKEGMTVRRRGRPRKSRNLQGKKLFDEQSSSEEEDSIHVSDKDAQDEEQQEDDDEEEPLIHSIRSSSKLRSLRVSREENKGQRRAGDFGQATENVAASRTSGPSS